MNPTLTKTLVAYAMSAFALTAVVMIVQKNR